MIKNVRELSWMSHNVSFYSFLYYSCNIGALERNLDMIVDKIFFQDIKTKLIFENLTFPQREFVCW